MDSPNVNIKLYDTIRLEYEDKPYNLINIEASGLHVVNRAFKYGFKKLNWDMDGILRATSNTFKISLARRADYKYFGNGTLFL